MSTFKVLVGRDRVGLPIHVMPVWMSETVIGRTLQVELAVIGRGKAVKCD